MTLPELRHAVALYATAQPIRHISRVRTDAWASVRNDP